MNTKSEIASPLLRTILILVLILLAAALRLAPHPWNFTPVGAIAIFAGAVIPRRPVAFLFPLLTMFLTDLIIGFNALSPLVYASFLLSVLISRALVGARHAPNPGNTRWPRLVPPIAAAAFLGSLQFFVITNFGVWAFLDSYLRTPAGLAACYLAGLPLFLNTLAADITYTALLFGALVFAQRFKPRFHPTLAAPR